MTLNYVFLKYFFKIDSGIESLSEYIRKLNKVKIIKVFVKR